MFAQREAVGHAGDVVGHRARQIVGGGKVDRHLGRLRAVGSKQLRHDAAGQAGRLQDLRVAVQGAEQETLQLHMGVALRRAQAGEGRQLPHRIGVGRVVLRYRVRGLGDQVADLRRQQPPQGLEQQAFARSSVIRPERTPSSMSCAL